MQVSAQVDNACLFSSITNMSFGLYNPTVGANAKDATSTVAVRCVANSPNVRIAFDQGLHADAASTCAAPLRRLIGANGDFLAYNIYSDAARTNVRGCATGANDHAIAPASFVTSDTVVSVTQYGRIAAGQDSRITTYADTVGVTISF